MPSAEAEYRLEEPMSSTETRPAPNKPKSCSFSIIENAIPIRLSPQTFGVSGNPACWHEVRRTHNTRTSAPARYRSYTGDSCATPPSSFGNHGNRIDAPCVRVLGEKSLGILSVNVGGTGKRHCRSPHKACRGLFSDR